MNARRAPILAALSVGAVYSLLHAAAAFASQSAEPPPAADSPPPAISPLADAQQRVFRAALERLAPSIVRIETIGGAQPVERSGDSDEEGPVAPRFRQADGPTTGVICTTDGYIITSSFNFLRSPTVITVRLSNGRRFVARLVARDGPARLALLKIDADNLPVPQWLSRNELRHGQWLLTAGFGHGGQAPLVSVGVLSAPNRMGGIAIQTDAKTSPANYGGPLFDVEGRVVGINVPMSGGPADQIAGLEWYDSGIGFAVHADYIQLRLPQLRAGRDVERAVLGITLDSRDPVIGDDAPRSEPALPPALPIKPLPQSPIPIDISPQEDVTPPPDDGVRLNAPARGPAAAAGMQQGDVITHLDGRPTRRVIELRRILAERSPGDEIEVSYRRGVVSRIVKMKLVSEADLTPATNPSSNPTSGPSSLPISPPG